MIENNIKIKEIEIIGFQSENRKVNVLFSQRNTSIIYGENGSGKTTFLVIINAILKQNSSLLNSHNIKSIHIKYIVNLEQKSLNIKKKDLIEIDKIYIDESININAIKNKISKDVLEDENGFYIKDSFEYDWSEFQESELVDTTSLSLGIERGITHDRRYSNISASAIHSYIRSPMYRHEFRGNIAEFSEKLANFLNRRNSESRRTHRKRSKDALSFDNNHVFLKNIEMNNIEDLLLEIYIEARNIATERIQNALFDTLSFIFDNSDNNNSNTTLKIEEDFMNSLIDNKTRIIEALDENYDNNKFKIQMIKILNDIKTKDDILEKVDNKILYDLIKNMMSELEVEKSLLNSINIFIEQYNNFLGGNKKLIITAKEIKINIDNVNHSISVLSSGERHIFTFLALIIIEGRKRNFIFIDEPEISLNIKWQRVLMSLIEELAPNTQIIVASHSPILAKKMPDALVELSPERI